MNRYLSLQKRCNQTKVFGVLDEPVGAEQKFIATCYWNDLKSLAFAEGE